MNLYHSEENFLLISPMAAVFELQ